MVRRLSLRYFSQLRQSHKSDNVRMANLSYRFGGAFENGHAFSSTMGARNYQLESRYERLIFSGQSFAVRWVFDAVPVALIGDRYTRSGRRAYSYGAAQRSLTLWPTCSPSRLATLSIERSDSFVASAAVSIATGWSEPVPRAGVSPAEISNGFHGALLRQLTTPSETPSNRKSPVSLFSRPWSRF